MWREADKGSLEIVERNGVAKAGKRQSRRGAALDFVDKSLNNIVPTDGLR